MTKRKVRTLIILAACFILALLVAILPYKSSVDTKAYDLTLSVFSSRKMELEEGARLAETSSYSDDRKGLRVTGKNGSYVGMKETVAGKFDMTWIPENGLSAVTYTFENAVSKESFDLVVTFGGTNISSYVECNGEKAGLYYRGKKGLSDVTAIYNSIDTYTECANEYKAVTVSFDPETMSVQVANTLVWSFLSDFSDGRKVGFAFDSFETYTVKMAFSNAKAGASAIIYDINGQNLENTLMLPDAAPRIFAKFGYDGVVGQKYTLPQANVYDVLDGVIPASECEVAVFYDGDPIALENGAFTPTKTGKYQIDYTAENEAGFATTQTYKLNVNSAYGGEMVFGGQLPEAEVGAKTQLSFPAVEYVNGNISAFAEIPVSAEIFKDGTSVKTVEDARNGFTYTPSEAGSYEVVYKPVHTYYGGDEYAVGISVTADKIGYTLNGTLESEYTTLDKVSIPSMTMHTPDGDLEATWKIQFPNGGLYQNQSIKTTEAGTYNIIYTASNGENTYEIVRSFDVLVAPASLFETTGDVTMSDGAYSHNESISGLVVEAKKGGVIAYDNVIKLNEYDYENDKQNALLCELRVDPYTAFNADFLNLEIVLTDIHDPDNYVTIVLSQLWENENNRWSVLRAGHAGQPTVGLEGTFDENHNPNGNVHKNEAGFLFNGSMSATPNPDTSLALISTKIYFDYATRSVYAQYDNLTGNNASRALVADLDHDAYFDVPWGGFTTGECVLTIEPKSYVNTTARYVLLNVDGHNFTNAAFRDETAPKLVVETAAANGNTDIPDGIVGKEYPLFNAVAVDDINGVVDVKTRVYYRYANNYFDINVTESGFMPEYAGEYLVVYTATDLSGNESEYSFTVTVHEETYYNDNQMFATLSTGYETQTMAGKLVEVAKAENCGGGVGRVSYSVSVSGPNGENVALTNGAFRPTTSGTYTVNYTLVDYVKTQFVQSYEIEVAPHNGVIFFTEEISVPVVLLNGIEYSLPQMRALDYASGSAVEKLTTLTIKDQDGNALQAKNGVFAVTDSTVTSVTLSYACPNTEYTKEYVVPVRQTRDSDGNYNYDAYFYGEGVAVEQADNYIQLKTSTQGATVEFLRNVLAEKLIFEVAADAVSADTFTAFKVVFTDAKNSDIAIEFTVVKDGSGARVSMNGGAYAPMTGSFTGESNYRFIFKYNASTKMFKDALSSTIGVAKTCANGDAFNGFTSGAVKISVCFEQLDGEAALNVYAINNQNFKGGDSRKDYRAPEIAYEQTLRAQYELNTTVTVPRFQAEDVLGNVDLFVSVQYAGTTTFLTDAQGNTLNQYPYYEGMSFVLAEINDYVISLYAKDYMNEGGAARYRNSEPQQIRISVRDDVDPTIELNGKLPTSAKVNKEISLPTATVGDNGSADDLRLMVFWTSPDNVTTYIAATDGAYKFTPTVAGTYTVKYVVMDKYFNYAEIVGTIEGK